MKIIRSTSNIATNTTYLSVPLGRLIHLVQLLIVLLQLVTCATAFILLTSSNKFSSLPVHLTVPPFSTAFTTTARTTSLRTSPILSLPYRSNGTRKYNYHLQSTTAAAVVPYSFQSSNHRSRWCNQQSILRCTTTSFDSESTPSANEKHDDDDTMSTPPTELPGKHKWLGGAVDPTDGSIYGIPSNANDVICLYDTSPSQLVQRSDEDETQPHTYKIQRVALPPSIAKGKFKWLRGIVCDGYLYGIPAWSKDGVLKVNLAKLQKARRQEARVEMDDNDDEDDGIVSILHLPPFPTTTNTETNDTPTRWLWHGAALNQNRTAIYCIPSNAHDVLKIDLRSSTTSLLRVPKSSTPAGQTNKWYGGILGRDNSVYGIPYAASGVLKIDANTDIITLLGDYGVQKYNWHGGVLSPTTGSIYAFPSHHDRVMKINTDPATLRDDDSISLLEIHRPSYDVDEVMRYKWLGGCLGLDGNVYGMPSDASSILRINTNTDYVTTFGVVSGEKNKWQGGVLAPDGHIYAIPSNARNILCLDTKASNNSSKSNDDDNKKQILGNDDDSRYSIKLVGDLPPSKDKWQGGFIGNDGAIYCIPENFNQIMKVTPKGRKSTIEFL